MEKRSISPKRIVLWGVSAMLFLFALVFGVSWNKSGYCLGDWILEQVGLPAWSAGEQGLHYTGILAYILMLAALCIFALTTKEKRIRLRVFVAGVLILSVVSVIWQLF